MPDWRAGDSVRGAGQTVNSCRLVLRVLRESSSPVAVMGFRAVLLSSLLVSLSLTRGAVITGACERDVQCGFGLCCAVSLWLRGLRMCVPRGVEGDECHPFSHKVPYPGKRQHHTCPCLPHLACSRFGESKYRCTDDFKNLDF
ncbi:prokineticin-1 [Plectropomus leopardus]|uniref:prokineticin-1 n=1 Tax=Plectropomus leopardus TaxID=160734 RepID=UPI001C4BD3F3|nr:prokineticin-1 [Plectropomus leopardus]